MSISSQKAPHSVSSTIATRDFDWKQNDPVATTPLSVALVGPNETSRTLVAKALADTRRAVIREFNSYPPESEHLRRLLMSFDVVVLDLDSDPDLVLELVEETGTSDPAAIVVFSERNDPKLAIRLMRAGTREFLQLPFERGAVAAALSRITAALDDRAGQAKSSEGKKASGGLHVFLGSKGGSGVTTVACNVAIALAQRPEHSILLIDLALPIGDCALCLGISAGYSTEDALRNSDRLDASLLHNLLVKHRSGVYVLAAPTKVPDIEVSDSAIEKLIAVAQQEFDYVVVDVGSRIDVAAKTLFKDATTNYLVTQTGISELRNSNRLISQFFAEGTENLEIVINRFESRFLEPANEDVINKALGKPVRWKIPDDQDAARALQHGDGGLAETRTSRISLEMASSINGLPIPQERRDFEARSAGSEFSPGGPGMYETASTAVLPSSDGHPVPTITWPTSEPIAYGNRLTFAQLNARASAEGTLVYTPGPGYVLPVGTHSLWVTFTPAEGSGYAPQQASVTIVVTKGAPAISWPSPAKIVYGNALSETQLNASAPVPGKFEYSPGLGEMLPPGTHTLSVTFTPADTANYHSAQATVSLSVAKAKSAIHWPTPAPVVYGTQLSNAQLSARASVPGSFEYKPDLGSVLAAGEHELTVVFTPADTLGYSISQSAISLKVTKAVPAIKWPVPEPIAHDVALSSAQLNALAPVPGSFAYTPAAGEKLAPGVHELSAVFTPADTLNYAVVSATVKLTVTEKLPAEVKWPTPSAISYGTALSAAQLNATASVPGTFVYTPSAGHVLAPGRYTLSVTFIPSETDKYGKAQASVELVVEGSPYGASMPSPSVESPAPRAFTATEYAPAETIQADQTHNIPAAEMRPRETRTYKGAVYEKGEDGQWHLQKN